MSESNGASALINTRSADMTQIINEAIEALEAARAHILDAYRIWQADDVSAVPPPKSGAGSVIAKIDAVLSTLPIAVEGKAEPRVRHKKRGTEYAVITTSARLQASGKLEDNEVMVVYRGEDGQIWCRPEYEFSDGRFEYISSSPGKDGGQEVEAVGGWRWSFDDGDTWHHGPSKPEGHPFGDPDIVEPLYTHPQPASTAMVERLAKALEAAAEELDRIFCVPPVTELNNLRDQFDLAIAYANRGGTAARAALSASQSTSREGTNDLTS